MNRRYGCYDESCDAVIIIDSPESFINRSRSLVPIHKESKGDRIRTCNEGWLGCPNLPLDRSLDLGHHVRVKRSEEHTSELQSLMRISYAVFCLKKKNAFVDPSTPLCHLQQETTHTTAHSRLRHLDLIRPYTLASLRQKNNCYK